MEFQVKFGDKKAIADLITNALVGNGFSVHSIDFHEKGELVVKTEGQDLKFFAYLNASTSHRLTKEKLKDIPLFSFFSGEEEIIQIEFKPDGTYEFVRCPHLPEDFHDWDEKIFEEAFDFGIEAF